MTFNSVSFFVFLPVVYLVFHLTADRWRWLILLAASYAFYACLKAPYLLAVLLLVTWLSYLCGRQMTEDKQEATRKRWFWTGTIGCLAVLAVMKYFHFLETSVTGLFGVKTALPSTVVSIGVSYFTFQAISYLADVYLELEEPEPHFGRFALYLAFFPKLLQGPIERAGSLLPQLVEPYRFDYAALRSGVLLFSWGIFKKLVIADRLTLYVDQAYGNLPGSSALSVIIATYAYALQLYFDFSGYTDMARGTARLFGIDLTENFNAPYLATSIADFWRRWHISFSRWILDYIFKPLQMGWRNWGVKGTALALLVTFLVSGIWHGSSWGFVLWGLIHGIYLACSTFYRPYQKRIYKALGVEKSPWLKWWQTLVTFNLVSFAWIFFRLQKLSDLVEVAKALFRSKAGEASILMSQGGKELSVLALSLAVVFTGYLIRTKKLPPFPDRIPQPLKYSLYFYFLLSILVYGKIFAKSSFLYMQF